MIDQECYKTDRDPGIPHIEIIRSRRKTMAIEIKEDGRVLVRVPLRAGAEQIQAFLTANEAWIRTHLQKVLARQAERERLQIPKLSEVQVRSLAEQAKKIIPARIACYAPQMGVTYGRITIRNQKTRWGSCSAKGNLNFNCLLMLTPIEIVDYVVVHELAHRKEMNHSAAFWREVERVLPDYRSRRKWLKEYGGDLIARLP